MKQPIIALLFILSLVAAMSQKDLNGENKVSESINNRSARIEMIQSRLRTLMVEQRERTWRRIITLVAALAFLVMRLVAFLRKRKIK